MDSLLNKLLTEIYFRKLRRKAEPLRISGSMFSSISSCMVIIPEQPGALKPAKAFADSLIAANKKVTVFLKDSLRSELGDIKGADFFSYNAKKDLNIFRLLSAGILSSLKNKKFDAVIDLNPGEGLVSRIAALAPEAKIRIGTGPGKWERFYNISYAGSQNNYDLLYKNLLNSLSQF